MAAPCSRRIRSNCGSTSRRRSLTKMTSSANRTLAEYPSLIHTENVSAKLTKSSEAAKTSRDRHRQRILLLNVIANFGIVAAEKYRPHQQRPPRQETRLRTNSAAGEPLRPA